MKTELEPIETVKVADGIKAAAGQEGLAPKISHAVLLTGSQVARRILRVVFVVLVARALGPQRFGTYALLLAMVEMVALASGSGFIDYLTREAAKNERLGWGLGLQLVMLRLAYTFPVSAAAIGIVWLLGNPPFVLAATAGMFLTLVPRTVSETVQGVQRGTGRYGWFLAIELSLGLTLLAGGGLLLVWGGGLKLLVLTELLASGLAALTALLFTFRHRAAGAIQMHWGVLVRRSSVFNLYPLVGSLYNRIDVVMLAKLAGSYATGIYTVAYRAMEMFQLIPYGVLYSLLPSLSRQSWGERERQRLEKAMGLLLSFALVAVMGVEIFAGQTVQIVLGNRYLESVLAARILIWALLPMYMNFALNVGLLAMGLEKVFLITSSVCLAVNFFANLVLIPRLSWRAAAIATIATELVLLLQNMYWIRRALGTVPMPYATLRTVAVFLGLLAVAHLGRRSAYPMATGIGCFSCFLSYLYKSGVVAEWALVWRTNQSAAA